MALNDAEGARLGGVVRRIDIAARFARVVVVLAALLGAPQTPTVSADITTVCKGGSCDFESIQEAIDDPITGAGETISLLDAVYTEAGIQVHKSVSIVGAGASKTVVQAADDPGAADDRVFTVLGEVSATLRDLTVRNGRRVGSPARGGGILNNGTLTLERSMVTANLAVGLDGAPGGTALGGGIYNSGSMTITASGVVGNAAQGGDGSSGGADGGDGGGGGIANASDGILFIVNSTISGNSAAYGDGYG